MIEYGSIVYRLALRTSLRKLDVIQNQGLIMCCGVIRTSPACALQVKMGELPLSLRFKQLLMNYWAHLKGHNERTHPSVQASDPMLGKCEDKCRVLCLDI